jgi:hypothetical protein
MNDNLLSLIASSLHLLHRLHSFNSCNLSASLISPPSLASSSGCIILPSSHFCSPSHRNAFRWVEEEGEAEDKVEGMVNEVMAILQRLNDAMKAGESVSVLPVILPWLPGRCQVVGMAFVRVREGSLNFRTTAATANSANLGTFARSQ